MEEIGNSMQELTQQLNNFKPVSDSALGRVRGEVNAKVAGKLSETKKQVTELTEDLSKRTKAAKYNSTTLHGLMVSIDNLGKHDQNE